MNEITRSIFVDGKDPNVDPFAKAWKKTVPGSRFTNVFFTNPMESVNTLGQAYLRPMGVLNDARCYSACEIFSGGIQGHGVGTIFGEDLQTGGAGAAVLKLDPFLIRASPTHFKKFPFSQELASGSTTYANTLSVGFTQTIRTGRYKGQGIEDVGIKTDTVFRPQWSDLQPDSPTNTQYDRIAASLARTGRENGQSKLHFVCEPFEIETPVAKFSLKVESAVSAVGSTLGNNRIIIIGKTAGKQVLKTIRNVRIIPDDGKYMEISNRGFTFTGISDSVGLYQPSTTAPADGWNNLKGPWMIGNGVQYANNIDSSIDAFFTALIGTKINIGIDVALDSEPGCDFLYLSVKSRGGIEDFLILSQSRDGTKTFNGVSGRNMIIKGTVPFTTKSEMNSFAFRSRIFSAVVMGKAYYGLELVGGNKSHLAPLQTTINKGIRLFTGARLSIAIGPLLVETWIGSLLTRSLVSRVRLLERSVTKRTPINAICSGTDNDVFTLNVQGQLVRSQRWFWSRRTKQLYRNRYWLTPQVRPKTVKQRHSFALMEILQTCGDSASLQKYVTRQLLDTSGFFKDPSFDQSRAHGTRYLMLARMDALLTARKAIQIGILVDTHPFSVDHCILCDQQLLSTSIAHLVVECEQVTGHRIQSGLVPAIQKSRLRLLGRALDPGVENVYTWLRGGVINGKADLDQLLVGRDCGA
ncbi:hypothetical protein BASA50_005263 [Batrachochytrium salamandrivorans]|uniref:Jacalin-type lectin domain-containing protein n=1 Tax=Batrachochytrium salamandrivorans TaxID=1357716 RepID=A0ABQ8FG08_9FUNG|nr:hypothetical protein BASA50_005263 [Batrachochytrium salamandrivorans]